MPFLYFPLPVHDKKHGAECQLTYFNTSKLLSLGATKHNGVEFVVFPLFSETLENNSCHTSSK